MATKSAKLIKDNTNLKGKLKDTDQKKHKKNQHIQIKRILC